MISNYSELRYKEIIDVHTGFRLGYISDIEFDSESGKINAFITPGRAKFFGLLGYEDDYVLPWDNVVRIGRDIILAETGDKPQRRKHRSGGLI